MIHVRKLAAWLDDATDEALEACDSAMMQPGFKPESTRDILTAGYDLYHSPGYASAGLPADEREPDDAATFESLTLDVEADEQL